MASVNSVILIGNLGRDPEITFTKTGTACARFSIATTSKWTDKNGVKQEKTEWHDVIAWDKLASICGDYLRKGRQVYVEGSLQSRSWDEDGKKRTKVEIKANQVLMLDPKDSTSPLPTPETTIALDEDVPF